MCCRFEEQKETVVQSNSWHCIYNPKMSFHKLIFHNIFITKCTMKSRGFRVDTLAEDFRNEGRGFDSNLCFAHVYACTKTMIFSSVQSNV